MVGFDIKLFFCIIILFFRFSTAIGQQNDPDVAWYESFFQRGKNKAAEKVLEQNTKMLDVAQENHDLQSQTQALNAVGLIYLTRFNDYERAMDFFIRALVLEDSLGLRTKQIFTYLAIAQVFEEVGNYHGSAEFLRQAIAINDVVNNKNILVFILNRLGKVNAAMGRIEDAFENHETVLEYKDEINRPTVEAEALYNIGHLYNQQRKYEDALRNYKKALAIWRSIKDKRDESISLNDIGELYQGMKNYERAMANHIAALEIQKELDDKNGIAVSYNNIGVLYFEQKDLERAVENFNLALASNQASQDQMRKSYDYLSQCYNGLGNYKEALKYNNLLTQINDFIQNEKNDRMVLEAQSRYTLGKKESEIGKLESERVKREKEIEDQKKFRNILYIVIALIFVIVMLVFYLYTQKRRTNKTLEAVNEKVKLQNQELHELNATKDKFFSIISHDLKGPLNSLTSFSGLLINHIESLSKEEIQMMAKDLDKSVKNLFALLENLLEWSRSQTGNIDFKPEVFQLTNLLENNRELLQMQAQTKQIALVNETKTACQVKADKNSISTVIRNLLSNAIKFTPQGGTVSIEAKQMANEIRVSIKDTGVGMSAAILNKLFRIDTKHSTKGTADEKGTGLGLILCKDFIEKNGGRIWVESEIDNGSTFYFTLPSC